MSEECAVDEMANADRLYEAMDDLCRGEPAADVVYALAMMYAQALRDQTPGDLREAAKSFGAAVALEMKYPRSKVNLRAALPSKHGGQE